jgi:para-nitrobenzyl esterase
MFRYALFSVLYILSQITHADIELTSGLYQATSKSGVLSIKGIRYANPVDGAARWQEATPFINSSSQSGLDYGPQCPQPTRPDSQVKMQEDCLFLNVWAPENAQNNPVMVWIHGGGFRFGSGEVNGEQLAMKGAVVVSINYRLGPLGFIKNPLLPNTSANLGLKDMELALQWVQDNIQTFGGDKNNVTIFGVSAGGMAVNMLLASPSANGLFNKAIAQSGYGTWPLPRTRNLASNTLRHWSGKPLATAEDISNEIFAKVAPNAASLNELQNIDAMTIVNAIDGFQLPIVDGTSLPDEPALVFMKGNFNKVPLITGGNQYEGSVMPGARVTTEMLMNWFLDEQNIIRTAYQNDLNITEEQSWQQMFGDLRYLLSANVSAKANEKLNIPTYLYFHQLSGDSINHPLGMPHGSDAFVFWNGHTSKDKHVQDAAQMLRDYWYQFAKSGNPNLTNQPEWPEFSSQKGNWLVFNNGSKQQDHLLQDKMEILESLYNKRLHQH